jgi:hypothetical protein
VRPMFLARATLFLAIASASCSGSTQSQTPAAVIGPSDAGAALGKATSSPSDSGATSVVDALSGPEASPADAAVAGDSGSPTSDAPTAAEGAPSAASADATTSSDAPDGSALSAGDTPPGRPLMVDTTNPQLYTINFKPSDADPQAVAHDVAQTALLDTTKPLRAKLVVLLSGTNNPPGPLATASFVAALGFHAYAIAYENGYDPSTQDNPDYFGNSRFNELDGMGRTPGIAVAPPDSVEVRVAKALTYLKAKNAAGDWGYYFDADGQVRWSDVLFVGHSHGATSAAAYAKKLRLWRGISLSGPRDTNPVIATWLTLPSATPLERLYGFTGTLDPQHPDHIKSMQILGYLGVLTDVEKTPAPYGESHRLQFDGVHTASENCGNYAAACNYMLGAQ